MTETKPACVYCGITSNEVPLITLKVGDGEAYICPSHLPVLIHDPQKLINKLPGVDKLPGVHH